MSGEFDGERAVCTVCGEPLTGFGNKRLLDGVLCRNCAKRLSEWLSDEELSWMTAADTEAHLAYREANRQRLAEFVPALRAGGKYGLYIDAARERFVVSKKRDVLADNADVLELAAIERVCVREETDGEEGRGDIVIEIALRYGEIRRVRFRVNEFAGLDRNSAEFAEAKTTAEEIADVLAESGIETERIVLEYGK